MDTKQLIDELRWAATSNLSFPLEAITPNIVANQSSYKMLGLLAVLFVLAAAAFHPHFFGRPDRALRSCLASLPTSLQPWKLLFTTWTPFKALPAHVKGKVAVVTGADGGVGYETVVAFLLAGVGTIYMGLLREWQGEKLIKRLQDDERLGSSILERAIPFLCDFSDFASTQTSSKDLLKRMSSRGEERIHFFVGTVGCGHDRPASKGQLICRYTENDDGIEWQLGVNAINAHLFLLLIGSMFYSKVNEKPSRIVLTSSLAHQWATLPLALRPRYSSWKALVSDGKERWNAGRYSFSKLTQLLLLSSLQSTLSSLSQDQQLPLLFALHPGEVYSPFLDKMLCTWRSTTIDWLMCLSTTKGAWTGLFGCVADQPNTQWGYQYLEALCQHSRPSLYARDESLQKECWDLVRPRMAQWLTSQSGGDGTAEYEEWRRRLTSALSTTG